MKRLMVLFLFAASLATAEDTKLPRSTVMHSGNALVTLPAGTVVKVVEQGEQTVTIKVNGKVGTIPWSALDEVESPAPKIQRTSGKITNAPASPPAAASMPVVTAPPAEPEAPPARRPAQTMYGKAVEKARDNAASHEKAMVQPTDEILDGK